MADHQSTHDLGPILKVPGIRRWKKGWQAHIDIHGKTYSKSFPITTLPEVMQAWRQQIKTERRLRAQLDAFEGQRLPRSLTGWCYVYFVRSGEAVKIGRAVDPHARVLDLQIAHAGHLVLLTAVAAHAALETAIHKRFQHLRIRANGEWFRLEPDLIAFIRGVQDGANPVALLFEDPRIVLAWHGRLLPPGTPGVRSPRPAARSALLEQSETDGA